MTVSSPLLLEPMFPLTELTFSDGNLEYTPWFGCLYFRVKVQTRKWVQGAQASVKAKNKCKKSFSNSSFCQAASLKPKRSFLMTFPCSPQPHPSNSPARSSTSTLGCQHFLLWSVVSFLSYHRHVQICSLSFYDIILDIELLEVVFGNIFWIRTLMPGSKSISYAF